MATQIEYCKDCKYWKPYKKTKTGNCRRYPVPTPTKSHKWCGEFKKGN